MAQSSPLKVIIVGGSVAGLTLANCLDQAGIDYELLERGSKIVYEGGASIGLMANGLRIMDQLNVFEAIRKTTEPLQATFHRTPDGISYSESSYMHALEARHGYPSLFFERQELLEILHNQISDKSKVHTSSRVTDIKTSDRGVLVTTNGDTVYEGDIVVGADGVNSTVRRCMWDEIRITEPEFVESESTAMFSEYCCIFGISLVNKPFKGFGPGISHVTYDKKVSLGAIMGINGKVFWFLFIKMDEKHYAPNIPRFTPSDAENTAAQHKDRRLTEEVVFEDLWSTRVRCTIVALEEGVVGKWYNERTVLVGDSAHKMTPNAGQGGNTAIESAALLTNLLYSAKEKNGDRPLTTEEFTTLFTEYQTAQKPRADTMFDASTLLTRLQTRNSLPLELFANYALPILGDGFQVNVASSLVLGGVKLDFVDKELKNGSIPWQGWTNGAATPPGTAVLLTEARNCVLLTISWYFIQRLSNNTSSNEIFSKLRLSAFGSLSFDSRSLQTTNFVMNVLPVVGISMIESLRPNNQTVFSALPAAVGIAYQLGGAPLCASVYFLAHSFPNDMSKRNIPGGDVIDPSYAKTLNTALLTVYPPIALAASGLRPLDRFSGSLLPRGALSSGFWQSLPVLLAVTHYLLAKRAARLDPKSTTPGSSINGHSDLNSLRKTYLVLTVIPAAFNLWTLASTLIHRDLKQTMVKMWFPRGSWDYLLVFGAGLVWTHWNFGQALRLKGARANLRLAAILGSTSLLIGPGAVMATVWGLREEALRAR